MDEKLIENVVKRRHPEYDEQKPHWNFCELSYRGGREYITAGNVFRYFKEGGKDYADRLKRTYRANHTKRVVDTVNLHLFRNPPQRSDELANDAVKKFWLDPRGDDKGDINAFMKSVDQWLSVYGIIYIVVDNTPFVGESEADAQDASKPYAYILPPQRLLDVSFDQKGEIVWATVAEDRREAEDPFTSSGDVKCDVRLWMKNEWYLFSEEEQPTAGKGNSKWVLRDSGINKLGVVPIVPVMSEEGTDFSAPALVGDIVYMDRAVVNYGSALDEIIYGQTFSQLAIPASGVLPGSTGYNHAMSASRNRAFLYSTADGSNAKPEYIAPDASQAQLIIGAMQVLMRNIYSVTGTDNEANSQSMSKGKEYASGVVRAFDYSAIENLLVNKANALCKVEIKIAKLVGRYAGAKDLTEEEEIGLVAYPQDFDIQGLESDLATTKALSEVEGPTGLIRQSMRQVADKMTTRLSGPDREKIKSEIDGWQPAPEYKREQDKQNLEIKQKQAEKPAPVAAKTVAKK